MSSIYLHHRRPFLFLLLSESFYSFPPKHYTMGNLVECASLFPQIFHECCRHLSNWIFQSTTAKNNISSRFTTIRRFSRDMFEGPQIYNKCFYINSFKAEKERRKFHTFFTHFFYIVDDCQWEWVHNIINLTAQLSELRRKFMNMECAIKAHAKYKVQKFRSSHHDTREGSFKVQIKS